MMLCAVGALSVAQARTYFDKSKDILIAQFDSKPDTDDIHTQAALGCMLAHPDFSGINYYAVAGAYGVQLDTYVFIDSTDLFNMAFGAENTKWTDAHTDWSGSVARIKNEAKAVLDNGGAVWVQEAGQSDITADWVAALIADGVSEATIKSNVTVVQHSAWNQNNTDATDLAYVQTMTTYVKLDDGNNDSVLGNEFWTPNFTTLETSYLNDATGSTNALIQAMWLEADRLCDASSYNNPRISVGGLDYSDAVEDWWILFDESNVIDVDTFWARYVVPEDEGGVTPSGDTYYNESGGLVVMEAENTPSDLDLWVDETTVLNNAYTGDSYIEFTGNNMATGPATSPLEYTFKINTAGYYMIHLRGARETIDGRTDVANDCYIRVEGDFEAGPNAEAGTDATLEELKSDIKFFVYSLNDLEFTWSSGYRLDLGDVKVRAIYNFKAGETYKLVVSGRSKFFRLDRIVFRKTSVAVDTAQDTALGESEVFGAAPVEDLTYVALEDFPVTDAGAVPYYEDTVNSCLAIDASIEEDRTLFAQASRTFGGVSGVYDVRITTLTEEDGESIYRLLVNGSVMATYTNLYIGPGSALDRQTNLHTWEDISLQNGDTLAIESNTDTNGEIVEGTGTAWSRGRWSQIELMEPDTTVPDGEPVLLAEWTFDDESGATAADTVGGHDGTLSGATWVADGVKGSALNMGGVGNVTLPAAAFAEIDQAITVSFWAYGATNQPVNDVAFRAGGAVNIHLPYGNSNIYWDAGYESGVSDRIFKTASENEYKGQWNHWVFTKDVTTGIMEIYLNGALWQSGTGKVKAISGTTSASIGGVANLYYHGMMDEVRLYDGALSSRAVLELFESYDTKDGFDVWAEDYGLSGDDALSDDDQDGMNNLMEYALGGNPTNKDAGVVSSKYYSVDETGSSYFYFAHNERTDDSSLVYRVVSRTNLAAGSLWNTNNVVIVGESPATNHIKSVTNRVEGSSETMFLKLEVRNE
jgi:hypothetical protein